ncbi:type IV pilin protein [Candidatus Avelusimicrobium stercoris]|uniref:type IV pilin protein n=1 Tax=Candidatus Avelusimicrobium stercoris TaxID=1947924 RepID=UPI003D0B084E
MKGFTSLFPLLSSWKVVVQDLLLFKKRKTTDTGTLRASKPSSMTLNFINDRSRNPAGRQTLWDDGLTTSGHTVNTSILSSPRNLVGDPLLSKKKNDRFPTTTLGNDDIIIPARIATAGFTLIELLVVVLIIGILASVALPQYQKAVAKSRYSQLITAGKSLKDAMEVYYMANGDYPQFWGDLDIEFKGCTADTSSRYMLWCDKFAVDMFNSNEVNLNLFDTHGLPNNGKNMASTDLYNQSPAYYVVWLDNSPYPGKTECKSKRNGLCKTMGF